MKRQFQSLGQPNVDSVGAAGATPRQAGQPAGAKQAKAQGGTQKKRARQTSIKGFLNIGTPEETPATDARGRSAGPSNAASEWPSTAQRAFERGLRLRDTTPRVTNHAQAVPQDLDDELSRLPSLAQGLGSGSKSRPCITIDDDDDDDFQLFSSQTYTYVKKSSQCDDGEEGSDAEDSRGCHVVAWQAFSTQVAAQQPARKQQQQLHSKQPATQLENQEEQQQQLPNSGLQRGEDDDIDILCTQPLPDEPHFDASAPGQSLTPAQTALASQAGAGAGHADPAALLDLSAGLDIAHSAGAATPELAPTRQCSTGGEATEPGSPNEKPRLFDIFRPKSQRKMLIVVRHGESEYNRAVTESKLYADPMIFDPRLTERGLRQCLELRRTLGPLLREKTREYGEPLWVVSPLTRALQTFLESCPFPDRLPTAPGGPGSRSSSPNSDLSTRTSGPAELHHHHHHHQHYNNNEAYLAQPPAPQFGAGPAAAAAGGTGAGFQGQGAAQPQQAPLNIVIQPLISEFLVTAGDVGRPPADLIRDFPQLSSQLAALDNVWWYQQPHRVNCALTGTWGVSEPEGHKKHRVAQFTRWLEARPEKLIVLVGHSSFWYSFTGRRKRMLNCEVLTMPW